MLFGWVLSVGSRKISFLAAKPGQKDLEFIVKLVEAGKIRPVIDSRYPLQKGGRCHAVCSRRTCTRKSGDTCGLNSLNKMYICAAQPKP
jgi:NADPH:quinone reductase-like Zn-dependent oxidoreductase